QLRNLIHGVHTKGVRRQWMVGASLPVNLRCLYSKVLTERKRMLSYFNLMSFFCSPPPQYTCLEQTNIWTGGGGGGGGLLDDEPLDHVRKACQHWQANVTDELNALAAERGGMFARPRTATGANPLARVRAVGEAGGQGVRDAIGGARSSGGFNDLSINRGRHWGGGNGSGSKGVGGEGFLFDSTDLLEAVSAIRSPNRSGFLPVEGEWGLIQVQLRTPTLEELQELYCELAPEVMQVGLDDRPGCGESRFSEERFALGQQLLQAGYSPDVKNYAKCGLPASLRPAAWRAMLGLPKETILEDIEYFRMLTEDVQQTELVTDELFSLDVHFMIDDDKYFPFEVGGGGGERC
ncbi:unnamed protein product, partial [Choristocarpus tenellus]